MPAQIPFNKPHLAGNELAYIAEAVASGNASGDGGFSRKASRLLEERFGIAHVLLTPSCSAALEIATMLCDVGPGDEVVMPAFTFVSTANAVVRAGARPVFVDIRPDTLNVDEDAVEAAVTSRTRAVMAVHYGGVACDMDRIGTVAHRAGARVIEDAAHGLGARYRGRALGALGDVGCFSFHETKNVHCGQGGAVCVNRPEDLARAEILRDRGTNRSQFARGEVEKYTWVDRGSAYVLSELLAAYLYAQLEALDTIATMRARIYGWYLRDLRALAQRELVRLPVVPPDRDSNHHIFQIVLPDARARDDLMRFLQARAIHAVIHYVPLHTSPFGRSLGPAPALPVTEAVSARLLRLPLFHDLTDAEAARVAQAITDFFASR